MRSDGLPSPSYEEAGHHSFAAWWAPSAFLLGIFLVARSNTWREATGGYFVYIEGITEVHHEEEW